MQIASESKENRHSKESEASSIGVHERSIAAAMASTEKVTFFLLATLDIMKLLNGLEPRSE